MCGSVALNPGLALPLALAPSPGPTLALTLALAITLALAQAPLFLPIYFMTRTLGAVASRNPKFSKC